MPHAPFALMACLKPVRSEKCYRDCFMLFSENETEFKSEKMEYLIYDREICPESCRPHFQGYERFKVRQRFASAKKMVPGSHTEKTQGTADQNIAYCSKDGQVKEFGVRPSSYRGNLVFAEVLDCATRGEVDTIKDTY